MNCTKQGCTGQIVIEALRAHVMGSGAYCQKHLEEYHGKSLDEIMAAKQESKSTIYYCARCGKRGRWVSGAGQALCTKHEYDY